MQNRPGAIGDAEVSIERINYGKLASGADLRIPPSEGYGVTRRSRGLTPACDRDFSPTALMELRRFEPGLIEETAASRGCLLVRVAPPRFGELAPLILMRARFRPEDGENGEGRRYQQSAIWAVDFECWRRNPAALLALAERELEARPDLLSESESARFHSEPLRRALGRAPATLVRAPAAAFILDALCNYAYRPDGCAITFGAGSMFASEAEFLSSAGYALQLLPETYPRWREISLVCGLRQSVPGLCLRYLPGFGEERAEAAA